MGAIEDTMRLIEQKAVTVALFAVNGLLALVAGMELLGAANSAPAQSAPVPVEEERLDLPVVRPVMASLSAYQEIAERPLFWSERRVVQEIAAAGTDATQTVMPFVLLGVVSGSRTKAILAKNGAKEVNRVAVGDVVEGWRIEAVNRQSVTLVSGTTRKELQVGPGLLPGK
jgi:hypothetical protein